MLRFVNYSNTGGKLRSEPNCGGDRGGARLVEAGGAIIWIRPVRAKTRLLAPPHGWVALVCRRQGLGDCCTTTHAAPIQVGTARATIQRLIVTQILVTRTVRSRETARATIKRVVVIRTVVARAVRHRWARGRGPRSVSAGQCAAAPAVPIRAGTLPATIQTVVVTHVPSTGDLGHERSGSQSSRPARAQIADQGRELPVSQHQG